jgi:secreted trypsin-like serine protease
MFRPLFLAASLVCLSLLASCGGDSGSGSSNTCSALGLGTSSAAASPTSPAATNAERIANGTPCTDLNKSPVVVVIKNYPDGSAGLCSGTLVTPSKVLTAAHCLAGAASVDVYYGATTDKFAFASSSGWSIAPNYTTLSNGAKINDVGIININKTLSLPSMPILVSSAPQAGQKVAIFGFGVTAGGIEDYGVLRAGAMTIAGIDNERIYANYESGSSDVCSGDSGGPMVLQVGNQQTVVGTTSYGTSASCAVGEQSVFMNLQSPNIQNFLRSVAPDARYY